MLKVASLAGRLATRSFSSSSVWQRGEGWELSPRDPLPLRPPSPPQPHPTAWVPEET